MLDQREVIELGKSRVLTVELSEEEFKDLEEFCKHHPDEAKTPSEALKKMAGLSMYRQMKKKLDKERKKPSVVTFLPQELGIPTWIPCALDEQLDALGMPYIDYIKLAILLGSHIARRALNGDKEAKAELAMILKESGIEPPARFGVE